jgi:septal ring factor EnvC (AmiA/AmiB activator)
MMFIKKYWTLIAIVAALLLGMFIAPRSDKDLKRQFEKKIKTHEAEITRLKQDRRRLDKDRATILAKAYQDSVKLSNDLAASNARISQLKRRIHEIDLSRANSGTLDSLVISLYPD